MMRVTFQVPRRLQNFRRRIIYSHEFGESNDGGSFSEALSAHNQIVFSNHSSSHKTDSASMGIFSVFSWVFEVKFVRHAGIAL